MKKIVIFGGGSGLSQLLKGLKLFPLEITAVVSVADNGTSSGRLRKEMNIPAVGDISKVLLSMANCNSKIITLMNYRFTKSCTIGNHSIKNLLLTALLDLNESFDKAVPIFCELLDIEGNILPLTEDSVNLVGITKNNKKIIGENEITKSKEIIMDIQYDKKFKVNPKVYQAIDNADLIIFASGSLFTSIMPHLVDKKLNKYIAQAEAKKLYVCNLFTQPGETDGFKVSDHIKILEKKIGEPCIDVVVANERQTNENLYQKYLTEEQKEFVLLDKSELKHMNKKVIDDELLIIENELYRHDSLKTAYLIFSYMMEQK